MEVLVYEYKAPSSKRFTASQCSSAHCRDQQRGVYPHTHCHPGAVGDPASFVQRTVVKYKRPSRIHLPSTGHLQIWRITGQIRHCRRNYQANLKEDVKFAEGKGEVWGGEISRRTERQRGGGERRGELRRGKGLAAVHGPPGEAEKACRSLIRRAATFANQFGTPALPAWKRKGRASSSAHPACTSSPTSCARGDVSASQKGPRFQEVSRGSFLLGPSCKCKVN